MAGLSLANDASPWAAGAAGLVSMLLGLGGLRVNTRCRGYAFALCSIVVAVVYFVAMLIGAWPLPLVALPFPSFFLSFSRLRVTDSVVGGLLWRGESRRSGPRHDAQLRGLSRAADGGRA